jgi:hypothetical protein
MLPADESDAPSLESNRFFESFVKGGFSPNTASWIGCAMDLEIFINYVASLLDDAREWHAKMNSLPPVSPESDKRARNLAPELFACCERVQGSAEKYSLLLSLLAPLQTAKSAFVVRTIAEHWPDNLPATGVRFSINTTAIQLSWLIKRPSTLFLVSAHARKRIGELAAIVQERYAAELKSERVAGSEVPTKAIVDPECAIAIALVRLTLDLFEALEHDTSVASDYFKDQATRYRAMFTRNRAAPKGLEHWDFSNVQDFARFCSSAQQS